MKEYYPSWRFHATEPARIVQNGEEDLALGEGWYDSPDGAMNPPPKPSLFVPEPVPEPEPEPLIVPATLVSHVSNETDEIPSPEPRKRGRPRKE